MSAATSTVASASVTLKNSLGNITRGKSQERSNAPEVKKLKRKVCLVGEAGTGKTELIRRFVQDAFDDRYITTVGAKVSLKLVEVSTPGGNRVLVEMTVWDILGQKGFRDLLKEAFFYAAKGILAVCDLTRKQTLEELDGWIEGVFSIMGEVPVVFLVNDTGKGGAPQVTAADMQQAAQAYDAPFYFTSTAIGDNVERAFQDLADRIVARESEP